MKPFLSLIVLALPLSACHSTHAEPFVPEPGKSGFIISCKRGYDRCYKQASLSCPSGFDVIDGAQESRGAVGTAIGNVATFGNIRSGTLVVACKT